MLIKAWIIMLSLIIIIEMAKRAINSIIRLRL